LNLAGVACLIVVAQGQSPNPEDFHADLDKNGDGKITSVCASLLPFLV
jgi:hypothetical protein